jgi:hypothetical protein
MHLNSVDHVVPQVSVQARRGRSGSVLTVAFFRGPQKTEALFVYSGVQLKITNHILGPEPVSELAASL